MGFSGCILDIILPSVLQLLLLWGTSTPSVLVPSLCPLASPATRIPLAQKGGEIPTTKFPAWPKTAGAKASWFPSPQADAPRPQGTARAPLSPGGSLAPSPALQPSPSEYGQEPEPALPTALGFGQGSLGWGLEGPSERPTLGYQ